MCPFTNGDIEISKINQDSLINAFCNDNNILKLEDVQRANELARLNQRKTDQPNEVTKQAYSSQEQDAIKLYTVDNQANLYIHGQLRKKIHKQVALNFNESQTHRNVKRP